MVSLYRRRKSSAKVEAARPNLVVLDSPNSLDTKEMEKLSSERPVENNTVTSAGSPQPGAGKGRVHGTSSASLGGDGMCTCSVQLGLACHYVGLEELSACLLCLQWWVGSFTAIRVVSLTY